MSAMLIRGYVTKKNGKKINFFIPLIIIYVLLLPFYVISLVVYLFFIIFSNEFNDIKAYLKIFLNLPVIFNSMKNLSIIINNDEEDIKILVKWGFLWVKKRRKF